MPKMRAKMELIEVRKDSDTQETLSFRAVAKSTSYPADGSDEDNTYAKFSPAGSVSLTVANPALLGGFEAKERYYIDFTPVGAPVPDFEGSPRTSKMSGAVA